MPIHIEINEAHADLLIEFYIDRLRIVKNEIASLEKESKEINAQILRLKRGKNSSFNIQAAPEVSFPTLSLGYSDKWPWAKKIEFALTSKGRPMTTKEIVDTLIEYEVGLMFERKKAIASVSSILSTKSSKEGTEFIRLETESGDFAYDLADASEETASDKIEDLPF